MRYCARLAASAFVALIAPLSAEAQQPLEIRSVERVQSCWDRGDGVLTGRGLEIDTAPSRRTGWTVPRGAANVVTLENNGPPDQRLDIVFVGDGYTEAELPLFRAQVDAQVQALFQIEPFKSYRSHINIHRVDVISNESGVDHDPTLGVLRDTALDMGFWCQGNSDIERSLCVDSFKARSYAALAPGDEHVVALANSTKFGGAAFFGTLISCVSAASSSPHATLHHELGHSLFTLEDEYATGGPAVYSGPEFARNNISIHDETTQTQLQTKWWRVMGQSLPGFDGPTGAYEGARYSRLGIFRPSPNSMMRSSARPHNLIGLQNGVVALNRFDGDPFPLIDDVTQPFLGEFVGHDHEFFVTPLHPSTHELTIWWQLGLDVIPGQTGTTVRLCELQLQPGEYTLIVKLRDDTPWIFDEDVRQQNLFSNWAWRIIIEDQPADRTADGVIDFDDVLDFVVDFRSQDASADLADPAGVLDASDVLAYLDRFTSPCP